MLSHSRRVSRTLFEKILKKSTVSHGAYFSLRIGSISEPSLSNTPEASLSTKLEASRFSFVVSKKVAMKATKRNLIRRRGYASLEHLSPLIKPGLVVLFFAKKGIDTLSQKMLEDAILESLKQSRILIQ